VGGKIWKNVYFGKKYWKGGEEKSISLVKNDSFGEKDMCARKGRMSKWFVK